MTDDIWEEPIHYYDTPIITIDWLLNLPIIRYISAIVTYNYKDNKETPAQSSSTEDESEFMEDNSSMWEESDPLEVQRQQQLLKSAETEKSKNMDAEILRLLERTVRTNIPPISNMNLQEAYVSNVTAAIGTVSKFGNMVKNSENDTLVARYRKLEPYLKKKSNKIPKDIQMNKADIFRAQNIISKAEKNTEESGPKLDDWQEQGLKHIRECNSVVIIGPTSGGKSYLIKYAISEIREKYGQTRNIVLCLPTFPLALQTFSDIYVSSNGFQASLICENLNVINPESWIYVGTPSALNQYFTVKNMTYDIGIYDEIHAISLTCGNVGRSNAMHQLLGRCRSQLIALSATVSSVVTDGKTDIERLTEYLSQRTSIAKIHQVVYHNRVIPQESYQYLNGHLVSTSQSSDSEKVTPDRIFHLLCLLRERDMLPCLIFDMGDSGDMFNNFVRFLQTSDQSEYSRYHQVCQSVNENIREFNLLLEEHHEMLNSNINIDNLKGSTKAQFVKIRTEMSQKRRLLSNTVCDRIATVMERICGMIRSGEFTTQYPQPENSTYCDGIYLKCRPVNNPTLELKFLAQQYLMYNENVEVDSWERLPYMNEKTPYFRFGNQFSTTLQDIKNPGTSDAKWQMRKMMMRMAESEGLKRQEVDDFIQIVIDGLEFGVACYMKRFPFVIQYQILEMLKNKRLAVLFTEESMSMGINYPLRTSVMISQQNKRYPVSNLLQMAGRSGRRGFDTSSYVVYWNIENCNRIHADEITPLDFPRDVQIVKYNNDEIVDLTKKISLLMDVLSEEYNIGTCEEGSVVRSKANRGDRIVMNLDVYRELKTVQARLIKYAELEASSRLEAKKQMEIPDILTYNEEILDFFINKIGLNDCEMMKTMVLSHQQDIFHEYFKGKWNQVSDMVDKIKEQVRLCYLTFSSSVNMPLLEMLEILHNDLRNLEYKMSKIGY